MNRLSPPMEFSQPPLAIESFSRSWLRGPNSTIDGLEEPLRMSLDSSAEARSKELEFKMLKSERYPGEAQNFNFDVSISQSPDSFLPADQLFSDGLIKPFFTNQSKTEASNTSDFIVATPPSFSSRAVVPAVHIQCNFFGRWRKLSERILRRCFGYLRPLRHGLRSSRKRTRVDDIGRRALEVRSWSELPQASPERIVGYSVEDRCDMESSIYEAVLHCKKSINK